MTKELKIMTEIVEKMMKERQEAVDKVKENLPNTLPHLQLLLEAVQDVDAGDRVIHESREREGGRVIHESRKGDGGCDPRVVFRGDAVGPQGDQAVVTGQRESVRHYVYDQVRPSRLHLHRKGLGLSTGH